jgi:hypothetical protein
MRRCFAFWGGDHPITRDHGDHPILPCYTSRFPLMLRAAAQRCAFLLVVCFVAANCLAQQETLSPWQPPANEFVQQILSRAASPSSINLTIENLSSLSSADQATIKQLITTDFRNAGVRLVKPDSAALTIDITLSEDWQNYVWVAEIRQGAAAQTVIKTVPRPQKLNSLRMPILTVRKGLVWQQDTTVLDFFTDGQNLFVLEQAQLSIYGNDGGKWREKQTLAIAHDRPWPRDLRGRLQVKGLQITVFLPGVQCSGTSTPPLLQCRAGDDPWQLDQGFLNAFYSPTRNFFTGVLAGQSAGESVPAFFSGAGMQNGGSRQWVFAGTDGRARIFLNDISTAAITVNDWGSNLTGVQSGCGTGWQILASAPGDLNREDSIQAFEIEGRLVAAVSTGVDFDGPVLALWPGENAQAAHAVVQSATTGKFEAWSVTVACN